MLDEKIRPTGRESRFEQEEIIVSKTDLKGRITYANDVFLRVAGMTEAETIGAPHCIIRHPDMPRCVFKLLWDRIQAGQEIFAYVINMAKNGDHYWVLAHVTPSRDANGTVVGYHSNRRKPDAAQVAKIAPIYKALVAEEASVPNAKDGMYKGTALLNKTLNDAGVSYDEFVFSI